MTGPPHIGHRNNTNGGSSTERAKRATEDLGHLRLGGLGALRWILAASLSDDGLELTAGPGAHLAFRVVKG